MVYFFVLSLFSSHNVNEGEAAISAKLSPREVKKAARIPISSVFKSLESKIASELASPTKLHAGKSKIFIKIPR